MVVEEVVVEAQGQQAEVQPAAGVATTGDTERT